MASVFLPLLAILTAVLLHVSGFRFVFVFVFVAVLSSSKSSPTQPFLVIAKSSLTLKATPLKQTRSFGDFVSSSRSEGPSALDSDELEIDMSTAS